MDGSLMVKARSITLQFILKPLVVEVAAEVGVQDMSMETGKVVDGVTMEGIIWLKKEKMDKAVDVEGLIAIKEEIEVAGVGERIPLVVIMAVGEDQLMEPKL
jgi:hypothetical protein